MLPNYTVSQLDWFWGLGFVRLHVTVKPSHIMISALITLCVRHTMSSSFQPFSRHNQIIQAIILYNKEDEVIGTV